MNIRFVSSLSDEDEETLAAMLGEAARALLNATALAYTLRIETSSKRVYQHQKRLSSASAPDKTTTDIGTSPE